MVNTKRLKPDMSHFKFQSGMDGKHSSLFLAEEFKEEIKEAIF